MFPKPPRPEPPRRAVPTQIVQQREIRRAPDVLIVDTSSPPASPPAAPPATDAPQADPER